MKEKVSFLNECKFNLNLFFYSGAFVTLYAEGASGRERQRVGTTEKERVQAKRFVNVFSFIAAVVPVIVTVCVCVCGSVYLPPSFRLGA